MQLLKRLPLLALVSCAVGAPPGFSGGSQWTFPLVDPLDDGLLVTPVMINGKGPFLFAIDPDANAMIVDERVVVAAGMRIDRAYGPKLVDETDTGQVRFFGEILQMQIGDLHVENRSALVVKHGTYYQPRRAIDGVIGRSLIADSLVFGFNRDRGIAFLTTQGAFVKPAGAAEIHFETLDARLNGDVVAARDPSGAGNSRLRLIRPVPRKLAKATINGATITAHLDFGAVTSQLRDRTWARAGLQPIDRPTKLVDETGAFHEVARVAIAPRVSVGSATADQVAFVPYVEKRWDEDMFDGALGLDFFQPYNVAANWDSGTIYLDRRGDPAASLQTRLTRWGTALACPHVGCVTAHVIDPTAGKDVEPGAAHPGVVLTIARDPGVGGDLEVTLVVANRPDLPRLVANLPAGTDRVMEHLGGDWVGAELSVVDVSPFARACAEPGPCIEHVSPR